MKFSRTVALATLGVVLAGALPAAAQAQIAGGRSGHSTTMNMDAEYALRELTAFGKCYAKRARNEALALIATPPQTRTEADVFDKLFKSENQICLIPGTNLGAPLPYIRGVIAEGLYLSGVGVPATHLQPVLTLAQVKSLSGVAQCYAAGHREEVKGLLATRPGSKKEHEAVSALMDGFETCLPAGATLKHDATLVRFRLIEALLRLPPAATAASGK